MIKFLLYFTISFLLLSVPVNQKQLFYHLDHWVTPYTRSTFNKTKSFIERQLSEYKLFGMKIMDASPVSSSKQAQALDQFSQRIELIKQSETLESEVYSESELLQLKEMLKNSDI